MYGFQFELPEGWTCPSAWEVSNGMGYCNHDNEDWTQARLRLHLSLCSSVENFLGHEEVIVRAVNHCSMRRQEIISNQYGVQLGISHSICGSTQFYYIVFLSQGELIVFDFEENLTLVWNDIDQIHESIQLIDE